MTESVAAVVVTYNRKVLLVECLGALLRQTRPLDRIYVVDQASTDGTADLLQAQGLLANPVIDYCRASVNTGGAGGFFAGMRKAYEEGYSWIWVMDDDAIPDVNACEAMMPIAHYREVVAVANHKLTQDRSTAEHHVVMLKDKANTLAPYPRLSFSSFVGLLVRREAVDKVGLPKPEMFFLFDDNEYCARLLTSGDIGYAANSYIVHKNARIQNVQKKLFGYSYPRASIERYWQAYFALRNNLWRLIHHPKPRSIWPIARFGLSLIKEVSAVFVLDRDFRLYRMQIIYRAVSDALRDRFDNQFAFKMKDMLKGKCNRGPKLLMAEVSKVQLPHD